MCVCVHNYVCVCVCSLFETDCVLKQKKESDFMSLILDFECPVYVNCAGPVIHDLSK